MAAERHSGGMNKMTKETDDRHAERRTNRRTDTETDAGAHGERDEGKSFGLSSVKFGRAVSVNRASCASSVVLLMQTAAFS